MSNSSIIKKIKVVVILFITISFCGVFVQKSYAQDGHDLFNSQLGKNQLGNNQLSNSQLSKETQQLKSEVLKLNRELFILEEDLLFPASTQVAIFVSVDIGQFFKLDSVEVKINEQNVAGFLYTKRQRIALEQGGIQKLYLGNLKTGEHQLTAIFIGLDNEGRTVKRATQYTFEKEDDALMLELKLVDNVSNYRTQVVVEQWAL